MILNAYGILDLFLVLVRLSLGLFVFFSGCFCWQQGFQSESAEKQQSLEDRCYLLFLAALVLLSINVVSWPILYLLLQSYVPEWYPRVMCIYGVTQIGSGSVGISRFLPGLLQTLQAIKPVLVFLSGCWFVLYLINRRTQTAPLRARLVATLILLGLVAVTDAVVEGAYLLIPKKEVQLSTGCCTEAFDGADRASRFLPQAIFGEDYEPWLYGAYYGVNLGMALALFLAIRRHLRHKGMAFLLFGALLSLPVNGIFLIEIAAPKLLRLPHHYCPYDLLPQVPESLVAVILSLLGCFAVNWAAMAHWFAQGAETRPFLNRVLKNLLALAQFCYLGSVLVMSLELLLAKL